MTLLLYDDFVARMTLLLYHDLIARMTLLCYYHTLPTIYKKTCLIPKNYSLVLIERVRLLFEGVFYLFLNHFQCVFYSRASFIQGRLLFKELRYTLGLGDIRRYV